MDTPIDAIGNAATHSALTAVLAGFALAGLFLLIDQVRVDQEEVSQEEVGQAKKEENKKNKDIKRKVRNRYLRAMLLLFVAFLMSRILYIVNSGHEEGWHRRTAKGQGMGQISRLFPRCNKPKQPELTATGKPK